MMLAISFQKTATEMADVFAHGCTDSYELDLTKMKGALFDNDMKFYKLAFVKFWSTAVVLNDIS
jgi:hypothetical protein